jgi:soluble lytic murein transglycosylase
MMKNIVTLLRVVLYPYLIFLVLCFEYNIYLIEQIHVAHRGNYCPKKILVLNDHIQKYNKKIDSKHIAETIVYESKKLNIDALYVAAIVGHESGFKPAIRSITNDYGLMQLQPETAKYIAKRSGFEWKGVDFLKDPSYNIQLGIMYVKYLQDKFDGNKTKALMAYNWGPGNISKSTDVPNQVKRYAFNINSTHKKLLNDLNNNE